MAKIIEKSSCLDRPARLRSSCSKAYARVIIPPFAAKEAIVAGCRQLLLQAAPLKRLTLKSSSGVSHRSVVMSSAMASPTPGPSW